MNNKEILVTGGTGSLGKALVKKLLKNYTPKGIRIYSRDEVKQNEFRQELEKEFPNCKVSFLIGDVRDKERLSLACQGVNILIHTAAMKQVPACEYNPLEAIKTNINGACNVIYAAIQNNIEKVMNISTDKAVYPINLYGCTKAVAEKLFLHANIYAKTLKEQQTDIYRNKCTTIKPTIIRNPMFSVCRYGNVAETRGSVIPLWKEQVKNKQKITLTSDNMTRFWITLDKASDFVLNSINIMNGKELFIPKMPSFKLIDLLFVIAPTNDIQIIGARPGEKYHESIITKEEIGAEHIKYKGENIPLSSSTEDNLYCLTREQLKEKVNEI